MALPFMLGAVSATTGSITAYVVWNKSASSCALDEEVEQQPVFQRATLKHLKRFLP